MGLLNFLGNVVDNVGTATNLPGFGLSERIAGGNTANTGRVNENVGGTFVGPQSGNKINNGLSSVGGGANAMLGPSNAGALGGGNVLGASNAGPLAGTVTNQGGGGSAAAANNELASMGRNSINAQYGVIQQGLDEQAGYIDSDQQALNAQLQSLFGGQLASLDSQNQGATAQLDASGQNVDNRQTQSIRDLEGNLRSQMDNGRRQLGGNVSSANDALSYALTKVGAQERGKIMQQAQELHTQIDLKRADVKRAYDDNLNQLKTWKDQKQMAIEQESQAQLRKIRSAKQQANVEQMSRLNDLEMQLKQSTMSSLQSLDGEASSIAGQIQDWGSSRLSQFDQQQQSLVQQAQQFNQGIDGSVDTGSGNFAYNYNDIPGLSFDQGGQADNGVASYFAPQSTRRKDALA